MRFVTVAGLIVGGLSFSQALVLPSTSTKDLDRRAEAIREIEGVLPRADSAKKCQVAKIYSKDDKKAKKPDKKKISKGKEVMPKPSGKQNDGKKDKDDENKKDGDKKKAKEGDKKNDDKKKDNNDEREKDADKKKSKEGDKKNDDKKKSEGDDKKKAKEGDKKNDDKKKLKEGDKDGDKKKSKDDDKKASTEDENKAPKDSDDDFKGADKKKSGDSDDKSKDSDKKGDDDKNKSKDSGKKKSKPGLKDIGKDFSISPTLKRDVDSDSDFDFMAWFANTTTETTTTTTLTPRDVKYVTMNEVQTFTWTKDDYAFTEGMNGCSAMAIATKNHITWAHFPPVRPEDTSYVDTWQYFLRQVTNQAIRTGALDSHDKLKKDSWVGMRVAKQLWDMPNPGIRDNDGRDVPSVSQIVNGYFNRLGSKGRKNFDVYEPPDSMVWMDRVSAIGGWPPVVIMG
ncbi:unnamed protein product [Periconia digitata]|uniref:Uncharacterized protein n=1 Tax=Periconia digitata TaxID=1303443 RepID=A0A9W4UL38_9PLEO|nr:unnamed protein product [Periconia digitata]